MTAGARIRPRVAELLEADAELYARKAADYAPDAGDPFENFRSSSSFASRVGGREVRPVDAALVLMGVKISRLQTVGASGKARNEGFRDTLRDLRVYAAIVEALLEEEADADRSLEGRAGLPLLAPGLVLLLSPRREVWNVEEDVFGENFQGGAESP